VSAFHYRMIDLCPCWTCSDESVQVEEIAIVLQMLINMLNDIRDQLQRKWQLKSLCTLQTLR
jgi:hypothetical protein